MYILSDTTIHLAILLGRVLKRQQKEDLSSNVQDLNLNQLNDDEQREYRSYIINASTDTKTIVEIIQRKLYLSEEDKQFLRTKMLMSFAGCIELLHDNNIFDIFQLSSKEIEHCIEIALTSFNYIIDILSQHFHQMTSKQKQQIIDLCYSNYQIAIQICYNKAIDDSFRLKILKNIPHYMYFDLFTYMNIEDTSKTREQIFIYISQQADFSYFNSLLNQLLIDEKQVIYDKFYTELFGNPAKYHTFFSHCTIFGTILRPTEKAILIKKIRTKTRYKDIPYALRQIDFTPDEAAELQAIASLYSLNE